MFQKKYCAGVDYRKRRQKIEEDRKKLQGKNIMAPYYIGRP